MTPDSSPAKSDVPRRTVALLAFVVALLLAVAAEYAIRVSESPVAGIPLYLAAVALIAATAQRFHFPAPGTTHAALRSQGWWLLALGAAGSLALAWRTFSVLRNNTGDESAFWWWLLSMLPVLAAAIACFWLERPHTLWKSDFPASRSGRWWFWLSALLVLVVASLARFLWLDAVPFGVNPDEGDRAAAAIQIVRGTTPAGIFEAGWYYISMLYFHMMALAFKWFGIGYVQARAFTAIWGVLAVATGMWIGARHYSWRVGILAGLLAATSGVNVQFSRLTTEAGPTATLWLLSLALMLEGARGGRSLPWVLAGLAGGFSLFFYPTGRVWAALALLWGGYLLVRWLAARRSETATLARGLALAAVSALVIVTPYLAWVYAHPHELTLRYEQTTVFNPENAARLGYVDPAWSLPRLIAEQTMRTLGIVNRFQDGGGVWPILQPILSPALALLALLGIGIVSTRWCDPRATMLALAFWVGISGVVVTVETPNLIRMATAIPLLPLLAALTLEEVVTRTSGFFLTSAVQTRARWVTVVVAILLALGIGAMEVRFYFTDYARMNLWQTANQEGRALSLLPPETRYVSIGSSFHMINSGWVRLIAPEADRAGYKHPGSNLPFLGDGARDIGVLVYPGQEAYLPWLGSLYPDARSVDYRLPDEPPYFTLLHIPQTELAAQGKVLLTAPGEDANSARLVDEFGVHPEVHPAVAPHRWSATWRVPQQWNHAIRLSGPSATLMLDGMPFLANSAATPEQTVTINLARGDHALALTGIPNEVGVQIARSTPGSLLWFTPIPTGELLASDGIPRGLAATVQIADHLEQRRQDNTLATCCVGNLLHNWGRPTTIVWRGMLDIPVVGEYGFRLQSPGAADLLLDSETLIHLAEQGAQTARRALDAGALPIEITVHLPQGSNAALELQWQPPDGAWSILPHLALTPDQSLLWQPALPDDALLAPDAFPLDQPSETLR